MGRKINVLFDTLFVGTVIAGGTGLAFRADALFVHAELVVTAKTGTGGMLSVRIENSIDEGNWYEFAAFDSMNGVGSQLIKPLNPSRFVRVAWELTGGMEGVSFTFNVECNRQLVRFT